MRDHITQEDTMLMPEARALLTPEDQHSLVAKFDKFEKERIGLETHERMLRMVAELSTKAAA